jgi:hypothetical protein
MAETKNTGIYRNLIYLTPKSEMAQVTILACKDHHVSAKVQPQTIQTCSMMYKNRWSEKIQQTFQTRQQNNDLVYLQRSHFPVDSLEKGPFPAVHL